ncbi:MULTISPECIES: DUF2179 domain-containing protein [unclassified Mycoplasma]|uniref:DUF2179 domain-containing protein n=1 Tax=unclassified Mycoplasma TaxID=2683645 RepID=UPI00211B9895|nr:MULTISPECIES: DUF2179 domain-containing protein [unclassified Mycoplasma]UUM20020.1 YitT family protein [Mycoplasma sp. 1578d]UUM25001.1 YitT family protein [Mycoplasma sp. 3686d]
MNENNLNDHSLSNSQIQNYKMREYLINSKTEKLTISIIFQRYWWKVLLVILSSFLFIFAVQIFFTRGDTVPTGFSGFPTLLIILYPKVGPYFALIFFATNLPLFAIFWTKIKKSFLYLTMLFLIFSILANIILSNDKVFEFITSVFNFVPDTLKTQDFYDQAGNVKGNLAQAFEHYGVPKALKDIDAFVNKSYENKVNLLKLQWYNEGKTWPFFLYCALGALFVGLSATLAWIGGGSTAGTDIIAYYFVTKRKKSVGGAIGIVATIMGIMFLVIWAFVQPNISSADQANYRTIIGARELATFFFVLVASGVIHIVYPKYKKMKMVIVSSDLDQIVAYFSTIEYWHSYQIIDFKSGYDGKTKYKIETVVLLFESKNLISDLKIVDPNAWISLAPVSSIFGKFDTQFVDQ